ncbi:MAG TPA: hypothetical protein VGB44_10970 [Flavobacterium sp.]
MNKLLSSFCIIFVFTLFACNQTNNNSGQTTPQGTVQTNRMNSDMEDQRAPAEVDSVTSPGSNAYDLKTRNSGSTGTTTDQNMQNQQGTHGRSTTSGDNGTGGQ